VRDVTAALQACAFDDAAGALYRFIWGAFCDWYLEMSKPVLNGDDEAAKAETRATAAWALDITLKLLHPVMPFMTEALWDKLADNGRTRAGLLIAAPWPVASDAWVDPVAETEIGWLVDLVTEVRQVRAEMNVPPSARVPLTLIGASASTRERLARHRDLIVSLGRLESVREAEAAPKGAAPFVIGEATGALAIAGFIDLKAEKTRLTKEIATLKGDADRTRKKLDNPDFVARAPEEVVEENRERLADAETAIAKLNAALGRLEAVV
jgi:valyl-tRNA synthetase